MEKMFEDHRDQVEFFIVYIREAHPNQQYPQPTTYNQRTGHAKTFCGTLEVSIPTLIDGMDNKVGVEYAGFPDRIYFVGRDGKIAYKGGRGPFGFRPTELEKVIAKELKKAETETNVAPASTTKTQDDSQ